jgi:hypothetical protein
MEGPLSKRQRLEYEGSKKRENIRYTKYMGCEVTTTVVIKMSVSGI